MYSEELDTDTSLKHHHRGGNGSGDDGLVATPKRSFLIYWLIGSISILVLSIILNIVLIGIQFKKSGTVDSTQKPKNIIFMIGDGFGPAAQSFARYMVKNSPSKITTLPLDKYLVGSSKTYSSSSDVTDSAAGATAFSCALKTYNNAIGVDPNKKPCGTLMEAAIKKGMRTGLVATNPITDATPAAFSSHVDHRIKQDIIAYQQIKQLSEIFGTTTKKHGIDILMGGGRAFFLPNDMDGSHRKDSTDVIALAKDLGYHYVENRSEMNKVEKLPILGLFALEEMKYNIDRDDEKVEKEPTLTEMTKKALELITTNSDDKGFFMMVEGSRIDHCAHSNDISCQWKEVVEYNEAFKYVLEYIKEHPDTLVISTADHETGGITINRDVDNVNQYIFYTEKIRAVTKSTEYIASKIANTTDFNQVASILNSYGIPDLTLDEFDMMQSISTPFLYAIDEVINRRARIGFTTRGHTAVDVNVYSYGPSSIVFHGNQENIDIGKSVANLLDLDLDSITQQVNQYMNKQN